VAGHNPYPAVVVNRWWELLESNASIGVLLSDCAPELLEPPVNVLRLSLHPRGMAPHISNLAEWRGHLLAQLHRRAQTMGDQRLLDLHGELAAYPGGTAGSPAHTDVVLPLRYRFGDEELAFFSISATVGSATDVTVEELAIEAFYPADARTADILRTLDTETS
jgi:hypothetical protein